MTLDQYRAVADKLLDPFIDAADRLGVSPNGVSVVAFGFAVGAGGAFGVASRYTYILGAVCVFWNGWLDLVDERWHENVGSPLRVVTFLTTCLTGMLTLP
jgi:hypothetical protein